jgi:hypothetical protein
MRRVSALGFASLSLAGLLFASAGRGAEAAAPDPKPVGRLECLKPNETREEVRARHFLEPFVVLKTAARETKAEALSAKLCRLGDDWVYSIALLHRDGRYLHVLMDAGTGRIMPARGHDAPKT